MCGIAGFTGDNRHVNDRMSVLEEMCGVISHRGPDAQGFYNSDCISLGMRRLSIIDLSTGEQPIWNEDHTVVLVFNGEIYNYQELRTLLKKKGHRFSTKSDTETIVHAYEEFGEDCPDYLRGMFAFALWDEKKQQLLLARDRLGIKPLYYTVTDGKFVFASEIKSLLQSPGVAKTISFGGINDYFTFGYINNPLTIFEEVKEVLPGSILIWKNRDIVQRKYWNPDYHVRKNRALSEWKDELEERLDSAIRLHLVSDVPVGVFLSGGIDSSAILALMSRHCTQTIKTFSMGFEGDDFYDERPFAKRVAQRYNTEHHEFVVEPDIKKVMEHLIDIFDQPFANSSAVPAYYLSQLTSQHVKVALSGLGGDEIFGGYERYLGGLWAEKYKLIPKILRNYLINPFVLSLRDSSKGWPTVNRAKRFVKTASLDAPSRYLGIISMFSAEERTRLFSPEIRGKININRPDEEVKDVFKKGESLSLLTQMLLFDQQRYLPSELLVLSDRVSMAHSLEVRVPFLDHSFLEWAMTIPPELKIHGRVKKYILKEAMVNILPNEILYRKKRGFSIPLAKWIRGELREMVCYYLSEEVVKKVPYLNHKEIDRILQDHLSYRYNYETQLWALLVFIMWYQRFVF